MLKLYTSNYCLYCKKVEEVLHSLGLEYERMDVQENPAHRDMVIQLGGKMQIPFLIDEEIGTALFESTAIIAHLTKQYGQKETP